MNKDAHAWKYENAPKQPVNFGMVKRTEIREVFERRIKRFSEFNSPGNEAIKRELKAALGEIERLA